MARIMHTFVASWMVGLSLVLSVSAYYLLRDRHTELAKSAMRVALPIFVVLSFTQALYFGPEQAVAVTEHQPAKLAALEGLWETTSCAPLYLAGWVDEATQTTIGFAVPCLLSFLATGDFNAVIQGLRAFPPDTWAPVNLVFQVYHIMINLGGVFVAIGRQPDQLQRGRRVLAAAVADHPRERVLAIDLADLLQHGGDRLQCGGKWFLCGHDDLVVPGMRCKALRSPLAPWQ